MGEGAVGMTTDPVIGVESLVDDLYLTTRATTILKNNYIVTVGELINLSPNDLLRFPNCGKVTVKEIQDELQSFGLSLKRSVCTYCGGTGWVCST